MNPKKNIDFFATLIFTILGIFNGQVTVFYIIYLFWFQEFVRTIIDVVYVLFNKKRLEEKGAVVEIPISNFILLFIYLVFIVVLFGVLLNFNNTDLMILNMKTLMLKNIYFDLNVLVFIIEYVFYRMMFAYIQNQNQIFNKRHIVLHISIIFGAIIQMLILRDAKINNELLSMAVIAPFLILKYFFGRNE
jgi:hypothetical protein